MKPGQVIGRVTLSQAAPQFRGARWLVVAPMGPEQLSKSTEKFGTASTPVVYDNLGAGTGDTILYVEGSEATAPFDNPIPLDAINLALLDTYHFEPEKR